MKQLCLVWEREIAETCKVLYSTFRKPWVNKWRNFFLLFAKAHFKNGLKKDCTKIIKICAMKLCLLILITAYFACVIDEIMKKLRPVTSSMGKILLKPWTKIWCLTLSFSLDWHARKSHGHFRYRLSKFCFHFTYIWKFIYFLTLEQQVLVTYMVDPVQGWD